eukprot:13884313-Ditylum_brightwellii.AAC.1
MPLQTLVHSKLNLKAALSNPYSKDAKQVLNKLIEGSSIVGEGDINIQLRYTACAEAAATNPVATSLEYISLMNSMIEILISIQFQSSKKESSYFQHNK